MNQNSNTNAKDERNGERDGERELSRRDFLPTASIEGLKFRAQILKRIRQFFDDRGFFEVQTPILSHDIVVDRYLEPVSISKTQVLPNADPATQLWLQTSPEFAMKRIMAAGADAIYQICPAIRAGEQGGLHNPEFTMLEWYRAGDDLKSGMKLLSDFVASIFGCGDSIEVSYRQLFLDHLDIDPLTATDSELASAALELKLVEKDEQEANVDRDNWLNLLLSQAVEPKLDPAIATIVFDWPESQSALAIVREGCDESPAVAERFELYYRGVELANGYHELLDADELLARNRKNNEYRVDDHSNQKREGPSTSHSSHPAVELPIESRLLSAMRAGLPGCAGVAIGVDRLVMAAMNAKSISEVIPFPIDRA